jgi:hypothetical protein
MQGTVGIPITSTLVNPPGDIGQLGARIEVPITRAIASAWQPAVLDGVIWTVTLEAPVAPGDYQWVWRTNDNAEPPVFEAMVPLVIADASTIAIVPDFPLPDVTAIRPDVGDIAALENSRTAAGGGDEIGEFTDETRPTAAQVDLLIDQAIDAVLMQLPTRFPDTYYVRVKHGVSLYTAILLEGSYFREEDNTGSLGVWQSLFTSHMTALITNINIDLQQARLMGGMEPRPVPTRPEQPDWYGGVIP